jgi:adenylylsulfate kinase-like enzyme
MKKKIKNSGTLFYITGLSGSGKSTLAKKIKNDIQKKYGPTLLINGDDIRNFFLLKGYSKNDRLEIAYKNSKLFKHITDQNINIIFATVGMMHKIRRIFKDSIKNFFVIYIKSDVKTIKQKRKKKIYFKFKKNIVGVDIKPQFPKKPEVIIENYLDRDVNKIAKELISKIFKTYN